MDGNTAKLIALAREAGYYPPIDPPTFNRHGGLVPVGFNLTMTTANGTIYYTTERSDPRVQVTGAVNSSARAYESPLMLTTTTHIKARVLDGDTWSALHEATFKVVEHDSPLRITEIMYNPTGGNDYEFVELKNIGDVELDLTNVHFDEGIIFTFPPGIAPLAPGDVVVLARNPAAFAERYPDIAIGGIYRGKLSNKGERITLKDAEGNVVASIDYDDENGWPLSPDGRGDSLVMVDLMGDPHNPKNWQASNSLNGSPGLDD
jgi:hypothetical protein